MKGLINIVDSEHGKTAIFKMPLDNGEYAFMKVHLDRINPFSWCVVIVDREQFFKYWAKDPHFIGGASLVLGGIDKWCADYKYHLANDGFEKGQNDPVPLPTVECPTESTDNDFYISMVNGITRSIWLASKGAKFMPVECRLRKVPKIFLNLLA